MSNEYQGYPLFNNVVEAELRAYNRGVILANIAEDSFIAGRISKNGCAIMFGYFLSIPKDQRAKALEFYEIETTNRKVPKLKELINEQ